MHANLANGKETIVFGNDSIVIQKFIAGIKGGRTLDVENFTPSVIKAGHVIIKLANGNYAPMPVSGEAYSTLPEGASYAGILVSSILKAKPFASILTIGQVNSECVPYPMTSIMSAFQTACPHVEFIKDEEV